MINSAKTRRARRAAACVVLIAIVGAAVPAPHALGRQIQRPISDDVVYQFMPIAWRDSNNDTNRYGDFGGMTASLDYLQSLGVTAVWMNSIFRSPAYHGYHHFEPNQVNAWFGTETDFWNFVTAAHARGIKVMLDLVAYGVNRDSTYFTSAFGNPASPYDTWIAFTNSGNTQYSGSTYNTWTGAQVKFVDWDLRTAACRTQEILWCLHWVDPNNDGNPADGIDGWRLDHVLVTNDHGPGGWGYNLSDFWVPWHATLRGRNQNLFTFAEQADWGSQGGEFLGVFNGALAKQLLFGIRSAIPAGNASGVYTNVAAALAALPANSSTTERTLMASLGDHDVDRTMSVLGNDWGRARAAVGIIFTQPLTPMIYYGDEIGMLGVKANFGTDANDIPMREPFKWNRVAGPPMSNYFVQNSGAYTARYSRDNDGRSVEEQTGVTGSLLETYRSLIAVRRGSAGLRRGTYTPVTASHAAVFAHVRYADAARAAPDAAQALLCLVNLSGTTAATTLDLSGATIGGGTTTPTMLYGPALPAITNANKSSYAVTLGAYAIAIGVVDLVPPIPLPPPADIDGRNIPADAAPLGGLNTASATQTCGTGFGDNLNELDRLFVRTASAGASGRLRIGITGNLETNGNALVILLDTKPGGQNVLDTSALSPPPSGLNALAGTRLDAGFSPDTMFFLNTNSGTLYVDQVTLPTTGAATKVYRGQSAVNSGNGLLVGGTNPNSIFASFDNTNTTGVTTSSVANAAAATTGLEISIPYTALNAGGLGCGTLGVAAFICDGTGSLSNQELPGVALGTGNLGLAPNFTTRAGAQFLTLTVLSPADVDNGTGSGTPDGGVTIDDLLFYLGIFDAGDPRADLDDGSGTGTPDGGVTIDDLLYYLFRFDAGC